MSVPRTDILTYSGNYFSFEDLDSNVIYIEDIAQGLSNVCRFAGQSPRFYSVAQHSSLVYRLLRDVLKVTDQTVLMQGLLHDGTEAYLGDMTTPLKRIMPQYLEIERRLHGRIMRQFGLPEILDDRVKMADLMALAIEKRELLHNTDTWVVLIGVREVPWTLLPYNPRLARASFISEFRALSHALKAA
jgi:hypothetical protein